MIKKTRPVFIFKLVLSFVFFICSPLSASDDKVILSSKFWQQSGEAFFNREYPKGITPRAITLNKMTSSAYPMGDSRSVKHETGYVALYHKFDPKFVNSKIFTEGNIGYTMAYNGLVLSDRLALMAAEEIMLPTKREDLINRMKYEDVVSNRVYLPYEITFEDLAPNTYTELKEIGLTYRSAAKTKLISFGDLGESSFYRYEFSQQGGGRI